MLILLPPSEGKTAATHGGPVDLEELSFPELTGARAEVLSALAAASLHPDAHSILGVGASLGAELHRNTSLTDQPAAPAHNVYSGVLYDALGYRSLTAVQKRKAHDAIVVISALWGAVAFNDRVPAYRLSMRAALPATGKLAAFWRDRLAGPLDARSAGELVVDCRSSSYAAVWAPPVDRTAAVNVYRERKGRRTVVSHFAKHTRGELARHLLSRRGGAPATPDQLLRAARERWHAELQPATARRPAQLNIILAD